MKFEKSKNDMKETWREINTIIGKGKRQSPQSKFWGDDGNVITDFKKRSDIHDYPTRQINNLTLSLNRKSFSDHAIRTSGPHLWNSLPEKLKDSKTVKQFRNQLKKKNPKHLLKLMNNFFPFFEPVFVVLFCRC